MKNARKARFSAAIVAALGLVGAFVMLNLYQGQSVEAQEATTNQRESFRNTKDLHSDTLLKDHIVGNKDAPVTIVEYSSLTCPHCANFHKKILPEIKKRYIDTGKVKYIVREYPLDNLALAGFMLARCKDKKYNEIVEDIYLQQDKWAESEKPFYNLKKIVKNFGYTDDSITNCIRNSELSDNIQKTKNKAREMFDVYSTPTLFINGKMLLGKGYSGYYIEDGTIKKGSPPAGDHIKLLPKVDSSLKNIIKAVEQK